MKLGEVSFASSATISVVRNSKKKDQ